MKKILSLVVTVMCTLAVPQITCAATSGNDVQTNVKTVGVVTAGSGLNLRETAVSTSVVLLAIPKNTQVDVISKNSNNWYNVKFDGQTGWVSGAFLTVKTVSVTSPEITDTATSGDDGQAKAVTKTVGIITASSGLNLRKTAVSTSAVLAVIPQNTQVDVISKNDENWYNVIYNGQTGWVSGSFLTVKTVSVTDPETGVSRSDSSKLMDDALSLLGVPYAFGGSSRSGFDCSGYTQYVFKGSGIALPRTTTEQFKVGFSVSRGKLQVGDLVFFSTYAPGASHVGIYIGGGRFVGADSNHGVSISNLDDSYYSSRYLGARRVS